MLPWLPHPAHARCHGYPTLDTRVAMVTALLLLTVVAVVTHSLHACCHGYRGCTRLHVCVAVVPAHACCHGDPHPTRLLPWRPILGCQRPHPSPSCSPPVSPWFPIPHTRVVAVPLSHTRTHTHVTAGFLVAHSRTRVSPRFPHTPVAMVTPPHHHGYRSDPGSMAGRHGYRSPWLPVATVTCSHGSRSPWLPVAMVTGGRGYPACALHPSRPPAPPPSPRQPSPPRRHGNPPRVPATPSDPGAPPAPPALSRLYPSKAS